MVNRGKPGSYLLCVVGAVIAGFSLVMGLLILFVIPGACTFLSGLQLLILGFLFIIGVLTCLLGLVLVRRKRKVEADPRGDSGSPTLKTT